MWVWPFGISEKQNTEKLTDATHTASEIMKKCSFFSKNTYLICFKI